VQRPDHYKDNDAGLKLPRNVTKLAVLACEVDLTVAYGSNGPAPHELAESMQAACHSGFA